MFGSGYVNKGNRPSPQAGAGVTLLMEYFVVDTHLPTAIAANDKCNNLQGTIVELKQIFHDDADIWCSMEALSPDISNFCEISVIKPLYQYAMTIPIWRTEWEKSNFSIERLQAECLVFKGVILEQFPVES